MNIKKLYLLTAALAIAGCMVGPDYQKPALDLPQKWNSASASSAASSINQNGVWWKSFNDETLNKLVTKALAENQNRKVAEARILEARAMRENAASYLYPQLNADGQAERSNLGYQTFKENVSLYQANFDASYELDLFGGNKRQVQAEDAGIKAQEANYRDFSLSLVAELVREYITYRQLQHQVVLARDTTETQEKLWEITKEQYKGGTISTFDVSQAETLYKTSAARIPEMERQLAASGNRISTLLGETPGKSASLIQEIKPLPVPVNIAELDAPVETINRRPDIQAAEQGLISATALQGVAISEMYPKVSLSGLFGFQEVNAPTSLLAYNGKVWSLGGNFTAPLLNFGRIEGNIKAAEARQQQALYSYKQTVLGALEEVETGLSNIAKESQRRIALQEAVDSAEHTVAMARVRYQNGISNFTDVLQSEQQLYNARNDLLISESNMAQYMVALYKALGAPVADAPKQ